MIALRYNTASVVLHWMVAIMLVIALFMGATVLSELPNSDPEKINALKGHMIFGILITLFMVIRLVMKLTTINPPPLETGNPGRDKVGGLVHIGLYLLVILMGMSGVATAVVAGVPDVILGVAGAQLPESFEGILPREVHELIAAGLILLVVLHVAASLYHQFILKDNIMARMKFGSRFKD